MIKIIIGGSPCTHWSIAQKNNRETVPEGQGWELFKNYLIAKEKFNPDFFLYENNESAAQPIKDQIAHELGVGKDPKVRFTYINSALVSAQNRQRFYVTNFGDIEQPEDRGIFLKDILESGCVDKDKSYCLKHQSGNSRDYFKKHHTQVAFEPVGSTENSVDGGTIYEVKDGLITVKGAQYKIRLPDGYYIIRKLTVNECRRLQTIPDWYKMPCSASQNYKMLGNGWTIEVIKHILSYIPNIQNCTVEVLSMYDGMSCGQIALTELGCKIERYVSYEIDKYCIQTTQMNFPKTEQRGDAFQLRNTNWSF